MEPLERIRDDVELGDLVLLYLGEGDKQYVGFLWHKEIGEIRRKFRSSAGRKRRHPYQERFMHSADMVFCSVSPDGYSVPTDNQAGNISLEYQMQFIGVNLKDATMGPVQVIGYEVLRRVQQITETA